MPLNRRYLWIWAYVAVVVLLFQFYFPIVSDEAYFIAWGKSFSFGFYDHPPLPGWISFGLWRVGDILGLTSQGALHRVFAIVLGGISVLLVLRRARSSGMSQPGLAGAVITLVPGYLILFNLYLNDTLLAFTSLVFVLASEWAFRAERHVFGAILVAGLAFAAMLLTKYNGAVVYLGMLLALISWPAHWRFLVTRMVGISLVALGPFLLHLWWNWTHCSVNLAFNFGFRSGHATGFGPLWVVWSMLLMSAVLGFWACGAIAKAVHEGRPVGFFARVFVASLFLMFVVSVLRRDFGVNWGAPIGFLAVLALAESGFVKPRLALAGGVVLSSLTVLPIGLVVAGLQTGLIRADRFVSPLQLHSIALHLDLADGSLMKEVRPLARGRVIGAMEYGIGAAFDIAGFREVTVFSHSVFGRNQDLFTDFLQMDGRDFLVLANAPSSAETFVRTYFDSSKKTTIKTARGTYEVYQADGFHAQAYRKNLIIPTMSKYYDQSPFPYGRCYMDKYR